MDITPIRICERCQEPIDGSKNSNARHCSEACHHQAKKARRRIRRALAAKNNRNCQKCGNAIPDERQSGARFCSMICVNSQAASKRRDRCRKVAAELKLVGCSQCSEKRPLALDFHHLDPATKIFPVSRFISKGNMNGMLEEIAKCIILCANCHRCLPSSRGYNEVQKDGA